MNAKEAKEITLEAQNLRENEGERVLKVARELIYTVIRNVAEKGESKTIFDLKCAELAPVANKNYQKLQAELEKEGFTVTAVFERSINGARRMTVSW